MRFDYTKGKRAKYMVSFHWWNGDDHYYFHYLKEAKKFFDTAVEHGLPEGHSINIWDMDTDTRKAFKRF